MDEIGPDAAASSESSEPALVIAERLVATSVLLNRVVSSESAGLSSTLDAYIVLRELSAAVDPIAAIVGQLHGFVLQAGKTASNPFGDTDEPGARVLAEAVRDAAEHARALATCLRRASEGIKLLPPPIGSEIRDYIEDNMMMEELE
jgi:hypothetical protein